MENERVSEINGRTDPDPPRSGLVQLLSEPPVLLTTLVFDKIVRFVLLKGWFVNFFVLQILPPNLDQFFPDRADNKSLVTRHCASLALMLTETIAR